VGLFLVAIMHALLTWPGGGILALFVGGIVIAFVLEAIAVAAGVLEHELHPRIAGVPVTILLAWPAVVYLAYRVAELVVPAGVEAAALAAVIATATDLLADPNGVSDGVWRYPESRISGPRYRGVPWWNFLGWLVIVFVTAMLPVLAAG
jgi:putative membrane protein